MRAITTASHAQLTGGSGGGCGGAGGKGGDGSDHGGGDTDRTPQSVQSVPRAQKAYLANGPPSSQCPSEDKTQVLVHWSPGGLGGGAGGKGGDGGDGGHGGDGGDMQPTATPPDAQVSWRVQYCHTPASSGHCEPRPLSLFRSSGPPMYMPTRHS